MAITDILVHVDNSKHCSRRLAYALELARAHNAHLIGVYAIAIPLEAPYIGETMSAEIIETLMSIGREGADKGRKVFDTAVVNSGVSTEWRVGRGLPDDVVAEHGRYCDLVVAGQADRDEDLALGGSSSTPESSAIGSGRPVLVVPTKGNFAPPPKRILVGWNASREASRAVHDALPFLQAADAVTILAVDPDASELGPLPGADIARHLTRHGVKATVAKASGEDARAGTVLLNRAAEMGPDLLVMGCFGHSRVRELVLGGATRAMLREMNLPVLFSH